MCENAMPEKTHVWITGAGSGLGAALAHCLGPEFNISLSGRRAGHLDEAMVAIGQERGFVVPCDVADDDSVRQAHERIVKQFGPVDVLVNGAGIASFDSALSTTIQNTHQQLNINLLGVIRCIQSVLPGMVERGSGMIMTLNSVAAVTVFENCTSYAASKAGLLAYTRGLRKEVRSSGVKVVDLIVGATATPIWSADMLEAHQSRMMQPNDVANVMKDVILRRSHATMMVEELTIRPQLGDL
ncbi:MAG: SDR family oxidoreductase [Candidatus Kapabacteria bacterium]|nr:SDR family oxidoreductase [Candidatus Kapabacteria bacterium]